MMGESTELERLNTKILRCRKCPRLYKYIRRVAAKKVKRFSNEQYWGRPLSGFGDIGAELLIVGLAPATHGGNRTGRMFTGDSSGDWVSKVLFKNGLATKDTSVKVDDGFSLINSYITASVRCAPPQNKPLKKELDNCAPYLKEELSLLKNVRVIICLGKIAFDSCSKILGFKGIKFSHGKIFSHRKWIIICSYHPSRQNTQTSKLTWHQWSQIFSQAKRILDEDR